MIWQKWTNHLKLIHSTFKNSKVLILIYDSFATKSIWQKFANFMFIWLSQVRLIKIAFTIERFMNQFHDEVKKRWIFRYSICGWEDNMIEAWTILKWLFYSWKVPIAQSCILSIGQILMSGVRELNLPLAAINIL